MKKFLISTLMFLLMAAAGAMAQGAPQAQTTASNTPPKATEPTSDTVVEEIVARINNDIITRSEFLHSKQQLMEDLRQQYGDGAQAEYNKREPDTLRDLIDQDLLVQKGKDLGISVDDELVKRLDDIRKSMGLETMEDLEKAAQEQGVSYEDFKSNLRNQLMTQQVIGKEVGGHIQITGAEEQKFYDEHKAQLEKPEQVRLSEILIPVGKGDDASAADPQAVAAAQATADDVEKQLKAGAAFEDLAKKYSGSSTASQGGDLGYFKKGMLAKQLEDVTFAMKTGDVSQPIQTKQGIIILKVTEHNLAGLPPLNDVRNDIDQAIYLQKLQPALRNYLTKAREDAYIDIKPGYVDTGASPNETKPTITTSAATQTAQTKKKKKKKLLIF